MGERRGVDRVLAEKPKLRRPFERLRHRLEDNIKMHLQEVGCESGLDRSGSRLGELSGSCKCVNELFGLHKIRGMPWLYEDILASQEGPYSKELVSLVS
jgi:hypothetical protein